MTSGNPASMSIDFPSSKEGSGIGVDRNKGEDPSHRRESTVGQY